MYKALTSQVPSYLREVIVLYYPNRALHFQTTGLEFFLKKNKKLCLFSSTLHHSAKSCDLTHQQAQYMSDLTVHKPVRWLKQLTVVLSWSFCLILEVKVCKGKKKYKRHEIKKAAQRAQEKYKNTGGIRHALCGQRKPPPNTSPSPSKCSRSYSRVHIRFMQTWTNKHCN